MDVTTGGTVVLVVAILRALEAVARLFQKRRNKRKYHTPENNRRKANPNDKPGNAEVCKKHMTKLVEIEKDIEYIKKDIGELKRPGRG